MQSSVAESMRRVLMAMVCVTLMLIPSVSADLITRVELRDGGVLAERDLGIRTGAVSPDGMDVLIAGMDGYARLLSADEALPGPSSKLNRPFLFLDANAADDLNTLRYSCQAKKPEASAAF